VKEVLRTVLLLLIQCIEPIRVSLPLAGKTALQLLAHWTLAEELERSRSVWPVPSLQGSEPCALLPTPTLQASSERCRPLLLGPRPPLPPLWRYRAACLPWLGCPVSNNPRCICRSFAGARRWRAPLQLFAAGGGRLREDTPLGVEGAPRARGGSRWASASAGPARAGRGARGRGAPSPLGSVQVAA
jgi:hypothetical protein